MSKPADLTLAQLRDALIEGRLTPGTRLVTKELATSLGTSITPVREALVRFAASGVLTAEPAASFRVPYLSVATYEELLLVRKAVEGLAAEMAAARIADKEIEALEGYLADYLKAKRSRDPHLALKENKKFRFHVYAAARMPTLIQVIETLWLRAGPGFNYLYPDSDEPLTEHANYNSLLQALRARDRKAARAAIEHAIDEGGAKVRRALRQRDEALRDKAG